MCSYGHCREANFLCKFLLEGHSYLVKKRAAAGKVLQRCSTSTLCLMKVVGSSCSIQVYGSIWKLLVKRSTSQSLNTGSQVWLLLGEDAVTCPLLWHNRPNKRVTATEQHPLKSTLNFFAVESLPSPPRFTLIDCCVPMLVNPIKWRKNWKGGSFARYLPLEMFSISVLSNKSTLFLAISTITQAVDGFRYLGFIRIRMLIYFLRF